MTTNTSSFLAAVAELTYCNPFLPERIALEKQALGSDFQNESQLAWSRPSQGDEEDRSNVINITNQAGSLLESLCQNGNANHIPKSQLKDLLTYVLYYRFWAPVKISDWATELTSREQVAPQWREFRETCRSTHQQLWGKWISDADIAHLFACLFQVRRAFYHIYECIWGDTPAIISLRANVWQSLFTHNMRRYQNALTGRLNEIPTLITGPSGTGKELVARCLGMSQFIPFDFRKQCFRLNGEAFTPLNLTALSPTLIESELFGHKKGSFTGATSDSTGYLERCSQHGVIFLDEIGELDPTIQVKLLRVLQNRSWSRLGETRVRPFTGKIVAATNRHLPQEIENGNFRLDFYYRLCADQIVTPGLKQQLEDRPSTLKALVASIAHRIAGPVAEEVTQEALLWIQTQMPADYNWPGNVRELEQCVRNVMIRNAYHPSVSQNASATTAIQQLCHAIEHRQLTISQLQRLYATWVYAEEGQYESTAHKIGIDRRTVKSWLDTDFLKQIQNPG